MPAFHSQWFRRTYGFLHSTIWPCVFYFVASQVKDTADMCTRPWSGSLLACARSLNSATESTCPGHSSAPTHSAGQTAGLTRDSGGL